MPLHQPYAAARQQELLTSADHRRRAAEARPARGLEAVPRRPSPMASVVAVATSVLAVVGVRGGLR